MNADTVEYQLLLVTGIPMVVVWFGVILILAKVAIRGAGARPLRDLAIAAVVASGALTMIYTVLAVWHPVWYRHWMSNLTFLGMACCFGIGLHCVINTKSPARSVAERRLAGQTSLTLGAVILGFLAINLLAPGWYADALLVPFGILLMIGCVLHQRAQRQFQLDQHAADPASDYQQYSP